MEHVIGWGSSVILLATIGSQVYKQWKSRSVEGVSRWLFIGQVAASVGFVVYSWMIGSVVFVFTNTLILLSALTGMVILFRQRRAAGDRGAG